MPRPRKRQVRQSFEVFSKTLDVRGQLRGAREGDRRNWRGPARTRARASEPHRRRLTMRATEPAHVVVRAHADIASLRKPEIFHAIREALITVARLEDSFRVVHFSVQRTHLHFLVEASDQYALAKGMQVFGISAARHINACLRGANGQRRRGAVFPDRYHVRILRRPQDVRNVLAYVLNNWRHHGLDRRSTAKIDPYSSAITFAGWKERAHAGGRFVQPVDYLVTPLVWKPKTWLAGVGWQRRGLISVYEVPGGTE